MRLLHRVLMLVILSVVPALLVQGFALHETYRLEKKFTEQEAAKYLSLIEGELDRVVEGAQHMTFLLAQLSEVRHNDPRACGQALALLVESLSSTYELNVTDRNGRIICSSQPNSLGIDLGDRYHVSVALARQRFVVGEYIHSRISGRPALAFAAPYRLATGEPGGAIAVTRVVDGLASEFKSGALPSDTAVTLADRRGTVIVDLRGRLAAGDSLDPALSALVGHPEKAVLRAADADGTERVIAYRPPGSENELFLAVELRTGLLSDVHRLLWRGIAMVTATLVAGLLVARFAYSHLFARSFQTLEMAVRRWAVGDYSTKVTLTSPPELKEFGTFLNGAAAAMREREQVQRKLHESENRIAAVLANSSDGIIELDEAGRIAFLNARARQLLGQDFPSETCFWEVCPEDVRQRLKSAAENIPSDRDVEEIGALFAGRWLAIRLFPASRGGMVLYLRDETKRREMEEALRRGQLMLSRVINLMPIGVWLMDEAGRIVQSNPAGRRIWGGARYIPHTEFGVYKGWWHETGKPIGPEEWAGTRAILHGEVSINEEIDIECFDGTRKTILNSALPIRDDADRICGAFIVNEDITAHVAEREELRLGKREAESLNLAKSRLLAAAGHDLRQPLQSVAFLFAVLKSKVDGQVDPLLVSKIEFALHNMATMIGDVLDVSRLESGALAPKAEPVDLGPLISRLADEFAVRAEVKELHFRAVRSSLAVRSDPILLERMLRNLIDNALKYTRRGKVLVGCRCRAGGVRVEVYDTGIGIPPEQLEAIFQEFYQLGNPDKNMDNGIGLGLSIVQRLASSLGHRLYVRSTVGRGSCFSIEMPSAEGATGRPHLLMTSGAPS